MVHKTFISYKFSDGQELRDRIIDSMTPEWAKWYEGETCDSPDMDGFKAETIRKKLKDMIFGTSVTIVLITPEMIESKWIEWELEYSLRNIPRGDRTSRPNGLVAVIAKVDGSYDWFRSFVNVPKYGKVRFYDDRKTFPIIYRNAFNGPVMDVVNGMNIYDVDRGGYLSFIYEDDFLADIAKYVEIAYEKSVEYQKDNRAFDLVKTR